MDIVYLFGSNIKEEVIAEYECDFCSQTFQSQPERRCHTIQHFQQKSCGNCHTNLIRIADDWYELHVSANCNKGNGNYNLPTDNDKEADAEHSIKQEVVAETAAFLDDFPNDTLKISPSNSNASRDLQDYFDCSADEFVKISESNKLDCSPASNTMTQWNTDCSLEDDDDEVADDDEYDEPMNMNVEHLDKPAKMTERNNSVVKKRLERRVHRPKSNFTCDICKKVLISFELLEFHMIHIHYPEAVKKSVCKICDNGYSSKSQGYHSFRHHMRETHSDERNFKFEMDNCSETVNYATHELGKYYGMTELCSCEYEVIAGRTHNLLAEMIKSLPNATQPKPKEDRGSSNKDQRSNSDSTGQSEQKKVEPKTEARYDRYDHWIKNDENNSRSRCKMTGCKGLTHAFCTKCKVHLCFTKERNCFRSFHTPVSQSNAK